MRVRVFKMIKIVIFVIMYFIIVFIVIYFLIGSFLIGGLVVIVEFVVNMVVFYFYEKVWCNLESKDSFK